MGVRKVGIFCSNVTVTNEMTYPATRHLSPLPADNQDIGLRGGT